MSNAEETALGLKPRKAEIVLVKSGYLEPQLYEMAADWRLALTRAAWIRICWGWGIGGSSGRCSRSTWTCRRPR